MPSDKQALYDELLPLLIEPKRGYDFRIWSFCPCHSDGEKHGRRGAGLQGRSLSLHPTIGLTCFAKGPNCTFENIVNALRNGHARPVQPSQASRDHLVALYDYVGPDGKLVAQKGRWETPDGKRFAWRLPGSEKWDGLGPSGMQKTPLYGADALAQAPPERPVYYVEGEKAMEACVEHKLLATTHGGGSGTRDFGDSLEILRGRSVRLWPDNDAVGREYMSVVAARLRGIAKMVSFVTCPIPLPEKGDAFDYFAKGGTVEALERGQPLTEPMVEYLPDDGLRVSIPTAGGPAIFTFTEWESGARSLETQAHIQYGNGEPYQERLNLRSGSKRTELRRELDDFYGKEAGWTKILNSAYNLASSTYLGLDRSRAFADIAIDSTDIQWALEPLLPLGVPTILFGDGGAGKTYLAERILVSLATGLPICGMQGLKLPGLHVDWEDTPTNWARRLDRICAGLGLTSRPRDIWYWSGQGIPLAQQLDALLRKTQRDGIAFMVLDSALMACGGDPLKSELVGAFFAALARLKVTSLITAHITKAGETFKPFGSAMWHNQARRTWYVARQQEEESATIDLGLVCRKVNDGPRPKPIPIEITFEGKHGPVTFERGAHDAMPKIAQESVSLNVRVKAALAHGYLSVPELIEKLGLEDDKLTRDRVRATLKRGRDRQKNPCYRQEGAAWALISTEREETAI